MSYPNKEQIGNIEQELEKAEQEFRRASEAKDVDAMVQAHSRVCHLVSTLSAAWSGGHPTVFSKYFETAPAASGPKTSPEPIPGPPAQSAPAESGGEMSITELEKQLSELASKMQKCLEAGDMDGMLAANEKMGMLSDMMAKVELKQRRTVEHTKPVLNPSAAGNQAAAQAQQAQPAAAKPAGWSAGDTLALAKQRAGERKKQKLDDSFEGVFTEVVDPSSSPASGSGSAASAFFSDKMKSKLKDSSEHSKKKSSMTQDELAMKLEQLSFYQIMGVHSTASFEELHKNFLRKIKKLNKKLGDKSLELWQFQEFVAALCLAHDVLKNPNARLQYDLVILETDTAASAESTAKKKMMPLKEMIKFSTLVNTRDLNQALEEHGNNPNERDLGFYLVEKGMLSPEELDSILFGQKLVSNGKLTVAQFELAMQELRENSIPVLDTLIASEWIQPQDVFSGELF